MEKTLLVAHPSMLAKPFAFAVVVMLCFVLVGIPILVVWWITNLATTLTVTDKRTILRRGLLSKHESEVWHSNVRNVQVYQSFLNRIVGVGYLGVSSAGQSGMEIEVSGIPDPPGVQRLINRHRMAPAGASA